MIKLTADDFFIGLFAALASTGLNYISIRDERFDKSMAEVFNKLEKIAPEKGLDIRFRVRLHAFHNDSIATRNAIYSAAQNGLISLDNPEYQDIRFRIRPGQADEILETIPGGKELFAKLAEEFLRQYNLVAA